VIKLYNTMTRQKETFVPLNSGQVTMYVCGPTVYNYIHIGNARSVVAFDMIRKYFEYRGFDVTINFKNRQAFADFFCILKINSLTMKFFSFTIVNIEMRKLD